MSPDFTALSTNCAKSHVIVDVVELHVTAISYKTRHFYDFESSRALLIVTVFAARSHEMLIPAVKKLTSWVTACTHIWSNFYCASMNAAESEPSSVPRIRRRFTTVNDGGTSATEFATRRSNVGDRNDTTPLLHVKLFRPDQRLLPAGK